MGIGIQKPGSMIRTISFLRGLEEPPATSIKAVIQGIPEGKDIPTMTMNTRSMEAPGP